MNAADRFDMETRWALIERCNGRDYTNEVNRMMDLHDLVWTASKGQCKALPFLIDDPDDAVSFCDVDGGCDRHRMSEEIGSRLLRLRARRKP